MKARQLGDGGEHRPPHQHRRREEDEVLDDVQRVVAQRRLVEHGEVPQHDRRRKERRGNERPRDGPRQPAHPHGPEQPPRHLRGRAVQEQRREQQREHEVLRHVGAEEVVVREVVQRAVQGEEQHDERAHECRHLAARRGEPAPRHVEPAQEDEPYHDARMQVPGLPRRRHDQPPPTPRSVNWPKKRNRSATSTTTASRNGPPNRNEKNRLSILRCM